MSILYVYKPCNPKWTLNGVVRLKTYTKHTKKNCVIHFFNHNYFKKKTKIKP